MIECSIIVYLLIVVVSFLVLCHYVHHPPSFLCPFHFPAIVGPHAHSSRPLLVRKCGHRRLLPSLLRCVRVCVCLYRYLRSLACCTASLTPDLADPGDYADFVDDFRSIEAHRIVANVVAKVQVCCLCVRLCIRSAHLPSPARVGCCGCPSIGGPFRPPLPHSSRCGRACVREPWRARCWP